MVMLFWCQLTQVVLEKRLLNECSVVVVVVILFTCKACFLKSSNISICQCNIWLFFFTQTHLLLGSGYIIRQLDFERHIFKNNYFPHAWEMWMISVSALLPLEETASGSERLAENMMCYVECDINLLSVVWSGMAGSWNYSVFLSCAMY